MTAPIIDILENIHRGHLAQGAKHFAPMAFMLKDDKITMIVPIPSIPGVELHDCIQRFPTLIPDFASYDGYALMSEAFLTEEPDIRIEVLMTSAFYRDGTAEGSALEMIRGKNGDLIELRAVEGSRKGDVRSRLNLYERVH